MKALLLVPSYSSSASSHNKKVMETLVKEVAKSPENEFSKETILRQCHIT